MAHFYDVAVQRHRTGWKHFEFYALYLYGTESSVFQFAIKKLKIKIYRIIILPIVLYRCETWSLMLREERRLRVFENRVLRRVFGPKRDEVTGEYKNT